jgi:hypothetical protein
MIEIQKYLVRLQIHTLNFKLWVETLEMVCGSNKRNWGKETHLNAVFVSYPSANFD